MKNTESNALAGKACWENFPVATRDAIKRLLQLGLCPEEVEAKMRAHIDLAYSHLPLWKRKELAAKYFLAANYAFQNNKHLG